MQQRHHFVLALVAVLTLAGCSAPGDITRGWSAPAAPSYATPRPGDCLTGAFSAFEQPDRAVAGTVPCTAEHTVEVVTTGDLPADGAPPAWDSDPVRAAFAACGTAASEYLGGDWHTGRVFPYLSLPGAPAWNAGVRTWVCGLAVAADDLFGPLARTGSLRDGLKDTRPLALGCVDLDGSGVTPEGFYTSIDAVVPVLCTDAHDTEFAGLYTAPEGPFPADAAALNETVSRACFTQVAAFLGTTEPQLYGRKDIYIFWDGLTRSQWQLGDRVAHCFLNVPATHPLHTSVRGLGSGPLPS
ncbi:septum formation family protein [Dactylosporangium salmoneum]|uniref:Septum formation-related domain-containing protein n=1 Tax=Dactylosporangium salmoneum TaxID=53361 RepID=A0ABP5V8S2_9ACTN